MAIPSEVPTVPVPAAAPRRPRAAVGWLVAALVATLPVAALSVFRAVPLQWPTPVVQALSFIPWLALPAALAVLFAVFSRRVWAALATAALLAVQLFWLFPLDHGRHVPEAGARLLELKAMNINSKYGQADPAEIVRLVRENGIGLLAVQEHSQALEDGLAKAGLARLLPNRISDPTDDAAGSAVYSAYPLQAMGRVPDTPFQIPTVRVTITAGDATAVLDVTNVHTLPPVDVRIAQWRHDLAAVGRLAALPGNQLLIGDFNASYDHVEFRRLVDGGPDGRKMVDVGVASGARLLATWPMEGPPLPGIVIDHLVTSPGVSSSGYAVHPVPGSDHAAIMASLGIPATG
ncbi:endonuclease/exonuclease/phosphatase family protein [Arthrobacter sp. CJ23]|uniref:endonuclease/exonuclease/phosphatase family protein n=1 Tax=Arthrobacter sp. CJ23 TaxID=2972479 RepID=UPI00215C88FF|nr:endonuclease/exonuclease/phosphatase family protein [Arthrobacter sp. CJ23]UVJ37955.1 endonuclease/exonuclease/phosphatase family protein [Arthrobacter sp. CJ23]